MRDFTKNLFSFSWALSLFSARQMGSILNPQDALRGAPDAAGAFDAVTDAVVKQFGANLRQAFDVGDKLQGEILDAIFGVLGRGRANAGPAQGPRQGGLIPPRPEASAAAVAKPVNP